MEVSNTGSSSLKELNHFILGITWEREMQNCMMVVEKINQLKPKFVIICGDLVHAFPPSYPKTNKWNLNQAEMYQNQVRDFKKIFSKIDKSIDLVCVCGNHDVGDRPSSKTVSSYKEQFGDDYFAFW